MPERDRAVPVVLLLPVLVLLPVDRVELLRLVVNGVHSRRHWRLARIRNALVADFKPRVVHERVSVYRIVQILSFGCLEEIGFERKLTFSCSGVGVQLL